MRRKSLSHRRLPVASLILVCVLLQWPTQDLLLLAKKTNRATTNHQVGRPKASFDSSRRDGSVSKRKKKKSNNEAQHHDLTSISSDAAPMSSAVSSFDSDVLDDEVKRSGKTRSIEKIRPRLHPNESSYNHQSSELSIRALLIPRKVNIPRGLSFICFGYILMNLQQCLQTVGRPFALTCWTFFQNIDDGNDPSVQGGSRNSAPLDYQPSRAELAMVHQMAAVRKEPVPPRWMPSTGPMVQMFGLFSAWVLFRILLPLWSLNFKTWMKYDRISLNDMDAAVLLKAEMKLTSTDKLFQSGPIPLCQALVYVPEEQRIGPRHRNKNLEEVTLFKTDSAFNNNKSKYKHDLTYSHLSPYYFDLHHRRYYVALEDGNGERRNRVIDGGPNLHVLPVSDLLAKSNSGLASNELYQLAKERYGDYYKLELPTPSLSEALLGRVSSPLVSLQLVGRLLSVFDSSVPWALFSLATAIGEHWWNARRAIRSAKELAKEFATSVQTLSVQRVSVLRPRTTANGKKKKGNDGRSWQTKTFEDILPGDIFYWNATNQIMPVDALLLEGSALTNEAVLTGETLPQIKTALESSKDDHDAVSADHCFEMTGKHRNSVLFAGTTMLHFNPIKKHSKGIRCMALRTGYYSSRGDLMRALTKSRSGSVSNDQVDRDALRLVAGTSALAAVSCWHVLHSLPTSVSSFSKLRNCVSIILASVPSDIPLVLFSVAQSCADKLKKSSHVMCSEPGMLLTAANIDTVLFDKTGTITADTQSLSFLVPPPLAEPEGYAEHVLASTAVLAGCHSLIPLNDTSTQLVGDPLDIASLKYSGWRYNHGERSFIPSTSGSLTSGDAAVRLWQIKTFPFDPNRRTSSALLLVETKGGDFKLLKVVKGSPEVVYKLLSPTATITKEEYQEEIQELGSRGLRTIAMGFKDLSNDKKLILSLFGTDNNNKLPQSTADAIRLLGKVKITNVRRDDVEGANSFDYGGLACFDAFVRPSSARVLNGLRVAGIRSIMLTGDGPDVAIAVSRKAGLVEKGENQTVVLFDVEPDSTNRNKLSARVSSPPNAPNVTIPRTLSKKGIRTILRMASTGTVALGLTGRALESLLQESTINKSSLHSWLLSRLDQFVILAGMSPKHKESAVVVLTGKRCGRKVLMCGDGVNDVTAMKQAHVSVALLNGYEDEQHSSSSTQGESKRDTEDEIRRQRILDELKIGSNRQKQTVSSMGDGTMGFGDSARAKRHRVQRKVHEAIETIRKRAAARQVIDDINSPRVVLTWEDLKDIWRVTSDVRREERERTRRMHMGGAEAAQELWKEEQLRKTTSIINGNLNETTVDVDKISGDFLAIPDIKPGEASLASHFSLLRPAIDGVDSILRSGRAAASLALYMQREIALNSICGCVHMATLYHNRYRYGKFMWNIESFQQVLIAQLVFATISTPRPRLAPGVRSDGHHHHQQQPSSSSQSLSLFHPSNLFSVCGQALVRILVLQYGMTMANELEAHDHNTNKIQNGAEAAGSSAWKSNKSLIRSRVLPQPSASLTPSRRRRRPILEVVREVLVASGVHYQTSNNDDDDDDVDERSWFVRLLLPKFEPNYRTNVVFLLALWQRVVSVLANYPPSTSNNNYNTLRLLEYRTVMLVLGFSMVVVVCGFADTVPSVSRLLELKPWPFLPSSSSGTTTMISQANSIIMWKFLLLCGIDVLASVAVDRIGRLLYDGPFILLGRKDDGVATSSSSKDGADDKKKNDDDDENNNVISTQTTAATTTTSAADLEEQLLREEVEENSRIVRHLIALALLCSVVIPSTRVV